MALWTSDKYAHMCARIDTVSHTRIEMAAILGYNPREGCYRRIYPVWRVLSSYIPSARVGISKENTRGVGISKENTRINPGMGQGINTGTHMRIFVRNVYYLYPHLNTSK